MEKTLLCRPCREGQPWKVVFWPVCEATAPDLVCECEFCYTGFFCLLCRYAIRESNSSVKIFKNFKEKKSFKPDFGAEGMLGILRLITSLCQL